ncbi:MAG TPA: GDSL-type esterase/lipase family protein [Chthoniobacterales bacterium]|jgi:lysophospholipase L1-like esterase
MKALRAALIFLSAILSTRAGEVKVACVGDSITQGVGVANPGRDSYPAQLGKLLGKPYRVENFGYSGATLLKDGNNPYWRTAAFRDATKFLPSIVVIALGTNDSKPQNWDGREETFLQDYKALIAHFRKLRSKPRIFLCLPPPSFQSRTDDIREPILKRQRLMLSSFAEKERLPLINFYSPLKSHPEWLPDGVHPNGAGAKALADAVSLRIKSWSDQH